MTFDLQAGLTTAETLARQGGALLLSGFRSVEGLQPTEIKSTLADLVTVYDRQSEALITDGLNAAYPGHAIVGEEATASASVVQKEADYCWYVDPLDGTTNFVHGWPHFCVSIGLCDADGTPILGVIYDPVRDECFTAIEGGGARLNGKPIHVSETREIERALVCTSNAYDKWTNPENNAEEWASFLVRVQALRSSGSSALDLAYVAAGRMDGCWHPNLKAWDLMAGLAILREAGGQISNYRGTLEGVYAGQRLVASNGIIHERMLTILMMGPMAPRPGGK